MFVDDVIQLYSDNVALGDPFREKMVSEELEQEVGLSASPDAGDDLDRTIPFALDESIEIPVTSNLHVPTPVIKIYCKMQFFVIKLSDLAHL